MYLERVEQVDEGEHGEGERVQVPGLQQHLVFQQDQTQHLELGGEAGGQGGYLEGQVYS